MTLFCQFSPNCPRKIFIHTVFHNTIDLQEIEKKGLFFYNFSVFQMPFLKLCNNWVTYITYKKLSLMLKLETCEITRR